MGEGGHQIQPPILGDVNMVLVCALVTVLEGTVTASSRLQSPTSWTWDILNPTQIRLCSLTEKGAPKHHCSADIFHGESHLGNEQLNAHFIFLSYLFFFPKENNSCHASLIRKCISFKLAHVFVIWQKPVSELSGLCFVFSLQLCTSIFKWL